MAFTYTIKRNDFMGQGIKAGVFNASGVTSGVMTTGLKEIHHVSITGRSVGTTAVTYSGGTVTITCQDGENGSFLIYGQ